MRDRGTTIVLTTHVMEEAERLCDRVMINDHGTVVAMLLILFGLIYGNEPNEVFGGRGSMDVTVPAFRLRASRSDRC